jgi:hypothetical protein
MGEGSTVEFDGEHCQRMQLAREGRKKELIRKGVTISGNF